MRVFTLYKHVRGEIGLSVSRLTELSNLAFYFLFYLLVISGILSYNEYLEHIPVFPMRTFLLFALPFSLYAIVHLTRLVIHSHSAHYLWRYALFFVMISYMIVYITYQGIVNHYESMITTYNLNVVMWYFISFLLGTNLVIKEGYKRWVLLAYLLMIVNALLNLDLSLGRINVTYDYIGTMHYLGDSFALCTLLLITMYKDKIHLLLIIFLSIITLYYISSRTSLYAFIFTIPFIFRKNSNKNLRLLFMAGIFAAFLALLFFSEQLSNMRMLQFLFTGEDHSFSMRETILENNLGDLWQNWLMGDYAGQLRHGVFGLYIHNYLSLWRQFGIFPFLVFVILLFPFFTWFPAWWKGKRFREYDFLFYMLIFSLVEITFTRSYKYHFIWIALGMMTAIKEQSTGRNGSGKESEYKASLTL